MTTTEYLLNVKRRREAEEKLVAIRTGLSRPFNRRIEDIAARYRISSDAFFLEIFLKALDNLQSPPTDTRSIWESDPVSWEGRFFEGLRVFLDGNNLKSFERGHLLPLVVIKEETYPDYVDRMFWRRIDLKLLKNVIELDERYNIRYEATTEEKEKLILLNNREFRRWVDLDLEPKTNDALKAATDELLRRDGLLGEPDSKDKTRRAVESCIAKKKANPKAKNRTLAKEAVEEFFPEYKGGRRTKKIDAIRNSFIKKIRKRGKGAPSPQFSYGGTR